MKAKSPFEFLVQVIIRCDKDFQEKYKDCELTKGLKLDEKFKVINYKEEEVQYCDDIEFLVGDKQKPIVCRRKKGKGFVYSICTNSHNMPECLVSNLIK